MTDENDVLPPGDNAKRVLAAFVHRIERIEGEITGLNDDKKEIYAEAKGEGFDKALIRKVVAIRRKGGRDEFDEQTSLIDVYLDAVTEAEKLAEADKAARAAAKTA